MSLPSPIEPLNGGRVLLRTLQIFFAQGWRILLLAAIAGVCGEVISALVVPLVVDQAARFPALSLVPWSAQFPTFVLADTAVTVTTLVALGGGRPRLLFALLASLGLLPVCLVVDLVENVPDVIEQAVFGAAPQDDVRFLVSLLVAAAWNTVWMPALAVAAEEHRGPIATLRRSFELVAGNRIRTFSFTLMMHLGQQLLPLLIAYGVIWATNVPVTGWAMTALSTPFFAFASTSQATLYWELARLRDGVNRSELGTIFD